MKRFLQRWSWLLPGLFLAGCAPATITAAPTSAATPLLSQVGQVVTVPGWQMTVLLSYETGTPTGQTLLVVSLHLHNSRTRRVAPPVFTLTAEGEREAPGFKPGGMTPFPPLLSPGQSLDGELAWSVPITATTFALAYSSLALWILTPDASALAASGDSRW